MKKGRRFIFEVLIEISKLSFITYPLRRLILKLAVVKKVALTVIICSGVEFKSQNVTVEEGVLINRNCHLYTNDAETQGDQIIIMKNTCIAPDVKIITETHVIGNKQKRADKNLQKPVTIGSGCWIGIGTIILPGVKIGNGCVIGGQFGKFGLRKQLLICRCTC